MPEAEKPSGSKRRKKSTSRVTTQTPSTPRKIVTSLAVRGELALVVKIWQVMAKAVHWNPSPGHIRLSLSTIIRCQRTR